MKEITTLIILGLCSSVFAQPDTEVYLFDLWVSENGYQIENPVNVSDNPGYDNQPAFWPDGRSLLYARTTEGQTDIARYFIQSQHTESITNTLQGSEYSPTPMPDGRISSIRLDTTGLQRLYAYELNGTSTVLVDKVVVGYHAWITPLQMVAFILGDPVTLQLLDVDSQERAILEDSIGRSLHKIPNTEAFSYVDKSREDWTINKMELDGSAPSVITNTLQGSEDYCWTKKGEIIMGKDQELWIWKDKLWNLMADLSAYDLRGITRLAISPDNTKLAVVVTQ